MAGMYDVGPTMQGGSGAVNPGSASFYGFQQELMRRQQQEELLKQQQRQAALDELNRQKTQEELATSKLLRESTAAENTAKTNKLGLDQVTSTMTAGQEASPEQAAAVLKFGGVGLVKNQPAVAPATVSVPAAAGVPESMGGGPAAPLAPETATTPGAPAKSTYVGTDAQRTDEEHKKFAQETLNGQHDTGNEGFDAYQHMQATQLLSGGKMGSIPAGVINGPKPASETKSAEDLAIEKVFYDKHIAAGKSPTEAKVAARSDFNKLQAEQANNRTNVTVSASNERQDKTQLFQTKQGMRTAIQADFTKLAPDMDRVDRAEAVLNSPNFLADAVAAPEVLQIMAGGMGSGLRMTDAELRRVNDAQNKLDQFRGTIAKYGIGAAKTIQDDMRKNMRALIDTVKKARERQAGVMTDTMRKIDSAGSPEELDQLHANYMERRAGGGTTPETPAERIARLRKAAGL